VQKIRKRKVDDSNENGAVAKITRRAKHGEQLRQLHILYFATAHFTTPTTAQNYCAARAASRASKILG